VLALLDGVGLSPAQRALIEGIAENYLEIMALIPKPGVTLTELRSRIRYLLQP